MRMSTIYKNNQLDLFSAPIVYKKFSRNLSIKERFEEFDRLNPHVFEALKLLALEYRTLGNKKVGIKMLWEVLRWRRAIATKDKNSEFKLSNDYHSHYARALMQRVPELRDFFSTRSLRGDS